jgi:hypothetical protein
MCPVRNVTYVSGRSYSHFYPFLGPLSKAILSTICQLLKVSEAAAFGLSEAAQPL